MDIKEKAVRTVNEPKSEKEPSSCCAGVIPDRSYKVQGSGYGKGYIK
jgi:hypothetical protein